MTNKQRTELIARHLREHKYADLRTLATKFSGSLSTVRRALDHDTALARMRQAGAIITTTESAIFELLGEAGTSQFKQVLKIVK